VISEQKKQTGKKGLGEKRQGEKKNEGEHGVTKKKNAKRPERTQKIQGGKQKGTESQEEKR